MDAKDLLDQLLVSAKTLSEQGREFAEAQLGLPESGDQRDAVLAGAGKGALAAGALALLLGTKSGRRLTGSALKLGGLAALGAVAYKAYRNWQGQAGGEAPAEVPIDQLAADQAQARSALLLEAMIMAANADGHIDASERVKIRQQVGDLGLAADTSAYILAQLELAQQVPELARKVPSAEVAAEVYLASRAIINTANAAERRYLDELVEALGLRPALVAELEHQLQTG